jgi:hypothetical protein
MLNSKNSKLNVELWTIADYGHDELFSFSNVTDREVFDPICGIKSEAVGVLMEFRLGSFG